MSLARRTLDLIDEIVEEHIEEIGADENVDDIPEKVEWTEDELKELETVDEISPKRKLVVRSGKRMIKMTCGPGFRYDPEAKRCIKLTQKELVVKSRAAKKAAKKSKGKGAAAARKRALSMKKLSK